MAQAVIGALRVNLGLDSAQFSTGLKKADSGLQRFSASAKAAAAAAAAAFAGAATAVSVAVMRTVNTADQLGKVAERLGVNVEYLQEMRHAAEMSGMAVANFDMALRRFIRRSSEAAQGTGAAKGAFEELGISLTDGNGRLKDSELLLNEVADALQKVESPADKLRLAFKMFDTDGAAMVNLLNQGSAGIALLRQEFRDLGLLISQETIEAAGRFNDNLDRLSKTGTGLTVQLTARMLPTLESITAQMFSAAQDTKRLDAVAKALDVTFKGVVSMGMAVVWTFGQIGKFVTAASAALERFKAMDFGGVAAVWKDYSLDAVDSFGDMLSQIRELWREGDPFELIEASARRASSVMDEGLGVMMDWSARVKDVLGTTRKAHDDLKAAGRRVWEQTRTPAERYAETLKELNTLLEYHKSIGEDFQDTYDRAVIQAQEELDRALGKTGESFNANEVAFESWMRSVSDGFADAILKAESFGDVLKRLLAQLAKAELSNWLFSAITGKSGGGSILGSIFGGFRADGGPVTAGRPYIVGERGPELIVPRTSGQVIPNHELGGSQVVINQTIAPNFAGNAATRQEVLEIAAMTQQATLAALPNHIRRGGSYAQAVRGR